ncbi:MAG: hypothetical protein Q8K67_10500 [Geothrix sp.]|nr:hypothetical protein [Geothrix sp.]
MNPPNSFGGLSVLVYGRNDSHGYNLHKRAVISLNCLAEHLEPGRDELLFVDCNSPNDVPTFPEAIADLLTPRLKELLRIFRVRPSDFRRLAKGGTAPVLEGLARNIGIRRSSEASRWILSTNTDVVLLAPGGKRLTDLAPALEDGYYGLPRFDLPQALWETLDRLDPAACMRTIQEWADRYRLRLVVETGHPFIRYDNPGDFQLLLRQDLHELGGFHESMVNGPYHLDSNLAKRLSLVWGPVRTLVGALEIFHCDHSRQEMARQSKHSATALDWRENVEGVRDPSLLAPQPDWGAPGLAVEEVRLGEGKRYVDALSPLMPPMRPGSVPPAGQAADLGTGAELAALLPFLADHLLYLPPGTRVGLLGGHPDLGSALSHLLSVWVPDSELLLPEGGTAVPEARLASLEEISGSAQVLIFDPGSRPGGAEPAELERQVIQLAALQSHLPHSKRAKAIFLMAHNSWLGRVAARFYDLFHAPTATWILHGRARDARKVILARVKYFFRKLGRFPRNRRR